MSNAVAENLGREFNYYLEHQQELVKHYNGKVLAIKDQKVIGVYASELEAVEQTKQIHAPGTFLVQRCTPTAAAYTQRYHSRVTFH